MADNRGRSGRVSSRVAIGGVFSALCLLLMFSTALVPFATYAMPALAGAMLAVVVIENGPKAALMVYASVTMLCLFTVPDYESAMMFAVFFGYYPVLRDKLEKMRLHGVAMLIKLVVFNVAVTAAYLAMVYLFGMTELLEGMGDFGKYTPLILLGMGNLVFQLYDYALGKYIIIYKARLRPVLHKK
ncbi:MAG: hypothetical protein ACK5LX_02035 [Oscillospiraceae bacterium]